MVDTGPPKGAFRVLNKRQAAVAINTAFNQLTELIDSIEASPDVKLLTTWQATGNIECAACVSPSAHQAVLDGAGGLIRAAKSAEAVTAEGLANLCSAFLKRDDFRHLESHLQRERLAAIDLQPSRASTKQPRNRRIGELASEGKNINDIQDIIEKEYGEKLKPANIRKIKSREGET